MQALGSGTAGCSCSHAACPIPCVQHPLSGLGWLPTFRPLFAILLLVFKTTGFASTSGFFGFEAFREKLPAHRCVHRQSVSERK